MLSNCPLYSSSALNRHAEYMATAMDSFAVEIQGHRFHHATVTAALDQHANLAHGVVVNAIAAHDGHSNAGNVNFNDP